MGADVISNRFIYKLLRSLNCESEITEPKLNNILKENDLLTIEDILIIEKTTEYIIKLRNNFGREIVVKSVHLLRITKSEDHFRERGLMKFANLCAWSKYTLKNLENDVFSNILAVDEFSTYKIISNYVILDSATLSNISTYLHNYKAELIPIELSKKDKIGRLQFLDLVRFNKLIQYLELIIPGLKNKTLFFNIALVILPLGYLGNPYKIRRLRKIIINSYYMDFSLIFDNEETITPKKRKRID